MADVWAIRRSGRLLAEAVQRAEAQTPRSPKEPYEGGYLG